MKPTTIPHPFLPGVEMHRVPRTCPVPGFDLAFGDCVTWRGEPWIINSMHYRDDAGRPAASLISYKDAHGGERVRTEAFAPLEELRVFQDAEPYACD